jgi:type I restriction enzyme S subunit
MRSEWKEYKISEFADVIGGGTPSTTVEEYYGGNIPWLTPKDMSNYNSKYIGNGSRDITDLGLARSSARLVPKGTVLFTSRAPIGYIAIAEKEVCTNQGFKSLICNSEIAHNEYIYYVLKSKVSAIESIASGSTFKEVSGSVLKDFKLDLPSLPTQKKIAHILSTLDDKIELNRKMNQTLEAMAQALFKSWFVDFDPVHVKLTCKSDEELEVAARELGISKEVLELFPSEFEESELGMIPKGWNTAKIEKILKRYKAPKRYKKDAVESYGRTMVLEQGADIILGYHDHDGEFEATISEPMFIFGDHTCVMKLSTKPFSISENVIPLSGCIRNGYWTYYATYGQQTFQEYRRHWSELIVRDIVLADEAICDFFAEQVQSLILKIEQNILENNELIMTRNTLLPKLLSGELDVSEIAL